MVFTPDDLPVLDLKVQVGVLSTDEGTTSLNCLMKEFMVATRIPNTTALNAQAFPLVSVPIDVSSFLMTSAHVFEIREKLILCSVFRTNIHQLQFASQDIMFGILNTLVNSRGHQL